MRQAIDMKTCSATEAEIPGRCLGTTGCSARCDAVEKFQNIAPEVALAGVGVLVTPRPGPDGGRFSNLARPLRGRCLLAWSREWNHVPRGGDAKRCPGVRRQGRLLLADSLRFKPRHSEQETVVPEPREGLGRATPVRGLPRAGSREAGRGRVGDGGRRTSRRTSRRGVGGAIGRGARSGEDTAPEDEHHRGVGRDRGELGPA